MALCVPGQGREELWVLEVQSDDVGQRQLAAGTPPVDHTDRKSQQEDGDGWEDDVDHQLSLPVRSEVRTRPAGALVKREDGFIVV